MNEYVRSLTLHSIECLIFLLLQKYKKFKENFYIYNRLKKCRVANNDDNNRKEHSFVFIYEGVTMRNN